MDDELTASYLKVKLGNQKKAINEMPHDQSIFSRIDNIYSYEILYAVGIYTGSACDTLGDSYW